MQSFGKVPESMYVTVTGNQEFSPVSRFDISRDTSAAYLGIRSSQSSTQYHQHHSYCWTDFECSYYLVQSSPSGRSDWTGLDLDGASLDRSLPVLIQDLAQKAY